ncbi:lipoprotein-releasing system permease protein [Chitinophaga terrae (ex Kim and Jung 2007)]|uniref:Lipoprotein-releasing system permease protein n=1 Tax=Chitinophaga terrae (ex Kim and Jung 2007) TaxID=408074 RepID=A0A1H4GNY1_9BACT|nr:FtsX-like permease family protein [Chitinophaga terrae (ex Kim and Jung 2007)]MDQ0105144.1 lipoprotein-releasing system permease protein [Chitinophaga terrae (ex Kim and Jung 2007)]GEP93624.1 membrane protein [Chitinophaga terrae (ex Kim and Jung 2007)]SEB11285.1 lipoprotein-releasing system permease protein [Chitinophaga terrae (ex Kim and Jung 2007)]
MIWQFASRYFRAKKSTNAINIIAWVSVVAIAVGTGALIIILSVFNGFEGLVKSLYSSFYPPVKIIPVSGKMIVLTPEQLSKISSVPGVAHYSEVVEEKAVLRYGDEPTIAVLKGVDKNYNEVTDVKSNVVRGRFDTGDSVAYRAVLGLELEGALEVDVVHSLAPITVYLPRRNVTTIVTPEDALNNGVLYPVGTFAIQQEFNSKYVITNIDFMRQLLELDTSTMSALEISLAPGASDTKVRSQLQQILGDKYEVQTRFEQNQSLYSIMQVEKWAVYIILSFIMIIAAFNMIGSLYMLVIEKEKDITILKAMGARQSLIQRIFLAEGLIIAGIGTAIGFFVGISFCLLQQQFGWIKLQGDSFVVDAYPVSMHLGDFLLVFITIMVIGIAASWYPARRAAKETMSLKST